MSQIIKTTNLKSLVIITGNDEENAKNIPLHNNTAMLLATSNGSLVRVLSDAGRLQFVSVILNHGTITEGSQETKTHDELSFETEQDWLLLSMHSNLLVK